MRSLKEMRLEKGLTQKEVAEKIGMSNASYVGYEKGTREFTIKQAEEVSKLFGLNILDLYPEIGYEFGKWYAVSDAFPFKSGSYLVTIEAKYFNCENEQDMMVGFDSNDDIDCKEIWRSCKELGFCNNCKNNRSIWHTDKMVACADFDSKEIQFDNIRPLFDNEIPEGSKVSVIAWMPRPMPYS